MYITRKKINIKKCLNLHSEIWRKILPENAMF